MYQEFKQLGTVAYKPHPISEIYPLMSGDDFISLKKDIKAKGLIVPVLMYEGMILDGRNRFRACQEVGCEILFAEYVGDDPVGHVISLNQERRHLTNGQKAAAAVEALPLFEIEAKKRQGKRNDLIPNISQKIEQGLEESNENKSITKASEAFGTNRQYVADAKNIKEESPEVFEALKQGQVNVPQANVVSSLPEETQQEIIEDIKQGVKPTEAIKKHVHVAKNSGENEWYTPASFIESARYVMGSIDLDPASSHLANKTVQAKFFYTKDDDGLSKEWIGNVWLNPPYAQPLMSQFADRVKEREFDQAIVLVNNATETKWFQGMAEVADSICFPASRIKFIDTQGNATGAPLQGQAFLYFGDDTDSFCAEFSKFGFVVQNV